MKLFIKCLLAAIFLTPVFALASPVPITFQLSTSTSTIEPPATTSAYQLKVDYITATNTTATSTLRNTNLVGTTVEILGEYMTNFTNYVRGLFSAGTGITISGGQITNTGLLTLGNYASTSASNISLGTSTVVSNGLTYGLNIVPSANSILFTPTISGTLNNSGLTNSTIGATSPNSTLTFGSAVALGSSFTGDLNLGHANTWTALQNQSNTGTTTFSGGIEVGGKIATPYIMATSTATSTFAGGLNITGNDCFAQLGTCLQTFIQNATAYKQAVSYATAAVLAGTPTYANGTSGVGATLTEVGFGALTVDGQNPSVGQRVLVKNEAAQANNGIYSVTVAGSGIASYVLTRSTDYNTSADIYAGTTVPVLAGGSTLGDTQWTETTTGTITVGTTAIAFEETSFGTTGPTSVSNSDGTLNISPTTGAVVGSIALGHSNIWSALQLSSNTGTTTFSGGIESGTKIAAPYIISTSTTATSTLPNLYVPQNLQHPTSATATASSTGDVSIDTTTGQLRWSPDGSALMDFNGLMEHSWTIASSTAAYMGAYGTAGTTTLILWYPKQAMIITDLYCSAPAGTTTVRIGTGAASSTYAVCGKDIPGNITPNFAAAARSALQLEIGTAVGSPAYTTITLTAKQNAD